MKQSITHSFISEWRLVREVTGGGIFVIFLSPVIQHLKRRCLREEGLLLTYILYFKTLIVLHHGEGTVADLWAAWSHYISSQEAE